MKVAAGFVIYRVIQKDVQYLLLKASYGSKHWSCPKGYVDPGEDEFTTALRETKEEAGIEKNHLTIHKEQSHTLNYLVKGEDKKSVYWLAELKDPHQDVKISDEHTEFKWLNYEKAIEIANYKDFAVMLKLFDEVVKKTL